MKPNIEFVSYTGEYPNLCSGKLTVKIDGKEVTFSPYLKKNRDPKSSLISLEECGDYRKFWATGGTCGFENDYQDEYCFKCPWEMGDIEHEEYPKEIYDILPDLLELFNENVSEGCCGGCL